MKRKSAPDSKREATAPPLRAPSGLLAARVRLDSEYLVLSYPLPVATLPETLTPAERAIAALLVEGLSSSAIATRRLVALRTISNQIASLYAKIGVSSRVEFVRTVCGKSNMRVRQRD